MRSKTKKLIWAAPLLAVFAVAAALALFAAQPPDPALAHDSPGTVKNLTGTADGVAAIDLSWDAPAADDGGAVDGYRIDMSKDGNAWMTLETSHDKTTYKHTGLDQATSYYYRVFAVNGSGVGPVSTDVTIQTDAVTVPGAVIGLTATAMGHNQIDLKWSPPAKDGGAEITKYSIHWASGIATMPAQASTDTDADDGNAVIASDVEGTSYSHKKLTAGTRHRYVVYAHNSAGKATLASDTAAADTAPLVKPSPPTGVTAVQTATNAFSLYWYAPANNGGTAPIGYEFEVSYNGGAYQDLTLTWRNTASTSDAQQASADAVHTGVPATIGSPAVNVTTVQYRVYAITRNPDTGADPPITELKSEHGQSPRMTINTAAQLAMRIPSPATFINDNAKRDPKANVNLEWTRPAIDSDDTTADNAPDSIGGYRIDVSDDGLQWRSLNSHTRKTAAKYQYVDTEKKNRFYRVFAWHAQYLGPAQTTIVVSSLDPTTITAPGHVRSFTATAVGPSQIDLAWQAPASDGNAEIQLYRIDGVRAVTDTAGNVTFADFPTFTTPGDALPTAAKADGSVTAISKTTGYSHKKLKTGETWRYRVLAVTDDTTTSGNIRTAASGSAEIRKATTLQSTMPEAPEGLVAEDAKDSSNAGTGDRGVLLLWNAPSAPDGASIIGYRVQRMSNGGSWETLASQTTTNYTDYTDTSEPKADEVRKYQVAAIATGKKVGPYSNVATYPAQSHSHVMAKTDMTPDAQTVIAGQSTDAMDVMGYFEGGENVTYSASSDMPDIADATVDGSMVTINGKSEGSATITVTAADDGGMKAMQTIAVTVNPANVAPSGSDALDNVSVAVAKTEKADSDITDADGDTLTWAAMSSDEAIATATVDMGSVTITGVAVGSATITVSATDEDGTNTIVSQTIAVVVTNQDPTAEGEIADIDALEVGETTEAMDVAPKFRDADGQTLTYEATSSDDAIATADIAEGTSMLTLTGVAVGTATITVTATDPADATAEHKFDVNVIPANAAPSGSDTLGAVSVVVAKTAMVESDITDANGDTLTWDWTSADEAIATVEMDAEDNSKATVTGMKEGSTTITVKATDADGSGESFSQTIPVAVTNKAPTAPGMIPNVDDLVEGETSEPMDVAPYFADADTQTLTYEATSSDAMIATAMVDDMNMLTVTGVAVGTATITVTATDPNGETVDQTFDVTVLPANVAPTAPTDMLGAVSVVVAKTAMVQSTITDADGDTLTWSAMSSDDTIATAEVDAAGMVSITGVALGSATITVTATDADGSGESVSQTIPVAVTNQAPIAVGTIDAQTVVEGQSITVDVTENFSDADGNELSYTASSSDAEVASTPMTAVDGMVSVMGIAPGEATITVMASDGSVDQATQTFTVTVTPANMPPTPVGMIANVDVKVGQTHTSEMAASTYFTDPDADDSDPGDTGLSSIVASSDDSDIATATVNAAGMIVVTGVGPGTATITVTAFDMGGLTAEQTFTATVTYELVPPTLTTVNPVGSGIVTAVWNLVPGATGYVLVASPLDPDEEIISLNLSGQAEAKSGQLTGLTKDGEYLIFVVSFDDAGGYEVSEHVRVTAE